jgi:hypothetical protein
MRWLGVFAIAAGCGRIFYDPLGADAGPSVDGGEPCAGEDAGTDGGGTDAGSDGGAGPDAGPSIACPSGYVAVAANDALMTPAFCVMEFEAKAWADADADGSIDPGEIVPDGCDAGCLPNWASDAHLPVAVPEGRPWREVSFTNASRFCRALGPGYDLISNQEAMTLARELEKVDANWSGGTPGAGRMPEGRTDTIGREGVLDVQNVEDAYDGTGRSASDPPGMGWEQRRVLFLSTGKLVWDFPGNVQEWTDWARGGALTTAPPCPDGVWSELPAFSCPGYGDEDFDSSTGTYDSTQGVGRILGGPDGAMRRGGQVTDLSMGIAGIYGFNLNRGPAFTAPSTGFRCVFRPAE